MNFIIINQRGDNMSFILKPISFLIFIFAGFFLKKFRLVKDRDYRVLNRIVMTITLPCSVLHAFSNFERDTSLFFIVLLGLVCSFLPLITAYLLSGRSYKEKRAFFMLNGTGYSIGCFAMPLIQSFFGSHGAAIACLLTSEMP